MMRGCFLLLAGLVVSSCDRSDYVVHIQRAHIEQVSENGGSGYIVVDKAAADNMAKYGDVYIEGKFCPEAACEAVPVGSVDKYNQEPVNGGVKLKVEFPSEASRDNDYPSFWLKNVACLKVDAVQGFMGRAGKSDWNCSVVFSDGKALAR